MKLIAARLLQVWICLLIGVNLGALAAVATAQTPPAPPPPSASSTGTMSVPMDAIVVPAPIAYSAGAALAVVVTTLSGAVAKLYQGGREKDKETQLVIEAVKSECQKRIDDERKECEREKEDLRDRNEIVHKELEQERAKRLVDQDKLLREQKDILLQVMTTAGQMTQAMNQNTEALKRLPG